MLQVVRLFGNRFKVLLELDGEYGMSSSFNKLTTFLSSYLHFQFIMSEKFWYCVIDESFRDFLVGHFNFSDIHDFEEL